MIWEKLKHMSLDHCLTTSPSSHCIKLKRKMQIWVGICQPHNPSFSVPGDFSPEHGRLRGTQEGAQDAGDASAPHPPWGSELGGGTPHNAPLPTECRHHTMDRTPWLSSIIKVNLKIENTWSWPEVRFLTLEHSDFPRTRQLLRETEFPGSWDQAHPPDLFVDGVQLLLVWKPSTK